MELESELKQQARLHALVSGHVQGVGFRAFVQRTAESLGLQGWVRNRWDGSVEAVAEGEREILEEFLSSLWKGPRSSRVENITVDWQPTQSEFMSFFVRPSL